MLTENEMKAIDEVLPAFPQKRNAAIDALKIVQNRIGWISDEALTDIAGYLGMSMAELDDVATFYNRIYRCPVGKHVILLCDSVSCWIMEQERIRDHLLLSLGLRALCETSADGMFTVLAAACLGACDRAPVMMVDENTHGRLTPAAVRKILRGIRRQAKQKKQDAQVRAS